MQFGVSDAMEREYKQRHMSGLIDSFKPVASALLPLGFLIRAWSVLTSVFGSPRVTYLEVFVGVGKLLMSATTMYSCLAVSWSEYYKTKFGSFLIWSNRLLLISNIAEQIGLKQDHTEIMKMMYFITFLFIFGPIVTPTYEEHFFMIFAIGAAKPVAYIVTGSWCPLAARGCDGAPSWAEQMQLAVILCASAGVNYLSHAERRRIWRASPCIPARILSEDIAADAATAALAPPPADFSCMEAAAAAMGWADMTHGEREEYAAILGEEARDVQRRVRAHQDRAAAAEWQCDGHVLGAGPCGYVLRAIDADGRFLALKQVIDLCVQGRKVLHSHEKNPRLEAGKIAEACVPSFALDYCESEALVESQETTASRQCSPPIICSLREVYGHPVGDYLHVGIKCAVSHTFRGSVFDGSRLNPKRESIPPKARQPTPH
jgi:hypothetical protein